MKTINVLVVLATIFSGCADMGSNDPFQQPETKVQGAEPPNERPGTGRDEDNDGATEPVDNDQDGVTDDYSLEIKYKIPTSSFKEMPQYNEFVELSVACWDFDSKSHDWKEFRPKSKWQPEASAQTVTWTMKIGADIETFSGCSIQPLAIRDEDEVNELLEGGTLSVVLTKSDKSIQADKDLCIWSGNAYYFAILRDYTVSPRCEE